jgi:hypothetical protein
MIWTMRSLRSIGYASFTTLQACSLCVNSYSLFAKINATILRVGLLAGLPSESWEGDICGLP